ncbi:hypothetical protein BTRA_72 [Burkholderia thailandensis USAMRU Malaysia |nr:hypothetical protein BTQ_527 [Burkholderia thailandensis 2002721723]AHI79233.1 hypothetical protein BTJ_1958 [Burkholderia thailandensis E444]AIC86459.1 hypothetical protein BTRA_72 [Burkholderia thailandensis USAMRU Malaysia \
MRALFVAGDGISEGTGGCVEIDTLVARLVDGIDKQPALSRLVRLPRRKTSTVPGHEPALQSGTRDVMDACREGEFVGCFERGTLSLELGRFAATRLGEDNHAAHLQ